MIGMLRFGFLPFAGRFELDVTLCEHHLYGLVNTERATDPINFKTRAKSGKKIVKLAAKFYMLPQNDI